MDDSILLKKRFTELARRADASGIFTFTDFLGLGEQALLRELDGELFGIARTAFGGAVGAERVIVRFGDERELGYSQDFPIAILKCEPLSQKFADKLTHRDFLGAILNLGIERSTLGDIIIRDNLAYIFALESIAQYIISELTRVKHTDVKTTIIDSVPEGELYRTERRKIQVTSERLDAVIAKTFSLSRDDAQALFKRGLVFVSGRLTSSQAYVPKAGDTVSVRGYGRFKYLSYASLSKKGKFNVDIELFV